MNTSTLFSRTCVDKSHLVLSETLLWRASSTARFSYHLAGALDKPICGAELMMHQEKPARGGGRNGVRGMFDALMSPQSC